MKLLSPGLSRYVITDRRLLLLQSFSNILQFYFDFILSIEWESFVDENLAMTSVRVWMCVCVGNTFDDMTYLHLFIYAHSTLPPPTPPKLASLFFDSCCNHTLLLRDQGLFYK